MADGPISGFPDGGIIQVGDPLATERPSGVTSVRVVVGGLAAGDDASDVPFTPTGSVSSIEVQGAIAEVDGDVTTHISNPTGAHAASAVSYAPTGTISATDTQTAVAEVATDAAADTAAAVAGAPLISSEDELAGQMQIAVVATLPGSPDANTIYMITS